MEEPSIVIPHASTIIQRHQEKLRKASDAYYRFLIKKCLEAIEEMKEKYTTSVTLEECWRFTYEDISYTTLHYGFPTDNKYIRKPLIEGEDMPFVKAQKKMYESGYYLLEKDEHSECCGDEWGTIELHATRPSSLDNPDKLWHGYDVLSFLPTHQ